MPANTPALALPYPVPADTVDVPRDVKALADKLDTYTAIKPVRVEGRFTFPAGPTNDIPWSNTGNLIPVLSAAATPAMTANLSVSAGQVLVGKRMRVTVSFVSRIDVPAGATLGWLRTALAIDSAPVGTVMDVRTSTVGSFIIVTLTSIALLLNVGQRIGLALAQSGQSAQSGSGELWVYGVEE